MQNTDSRTDEPTRQLLVEHRHDRPILRVLEVVLGQGEDAALHEVAQLRLGHAANNGHAGFPSVVLAAACEADEEVRCTADQADGSAHNLCRPLVCKALQSGRVE